MEEELLPHKNVIRESGNVDEERRLCYVGMTRAKEQLCLIYPEDARLERRKKAGDSRSPASTEKDAYPASCFLYEANLDFSEHLGESILASESEQLPVEAVDLTIGKRYLKEVEISVSLKKKKREKEKRRVLEKKK